MLIWIKCQFSELCSNILSIDFHNSRTHQVQLQNDIPMKNIPVRHIKEDIRVAATGRFKIRKVEDILLGKDLNHELHRHDFYFILAIRNGAGWHEVDFKAYDVQNSSVFIVKPGQVHQLKLSAECTGFLAEFDGMFYQPKEKLPNERLIKAGNKHFCALDDDRFVKLSNMLAYMYDEFKMRDEGYVEVVKANLDMFFIEFMRQSRNIEKESKPENTYMQTRLEDFKELLETKITTHKQVSDYANLLNLSMYQLNAITKSSLGKSASSMINDQILLEAKRHLLGTANQIKEIADHLGYEDISYFIRFFKKHTGYSPETFRKNFQ